jgi:hypothetical protein
MTTVKGVVLWWRTIAGPGGNDPELIEIRRRTVEEFDRELDQREPGPANAPDPVVADILGGASLRDWPHAATISNVPAPDMSTRCGPRRRALAGEIGRVLNVPKQLLHRRFHRRSVDG